MDPGFHRGDDKAWNDGNRSRLRVDDSEPLVLETDGRTLEYTGAARALSLSSRAAEEDEGGAVWLTCHSVRCYSANEQLG
jgi:hypothetical protein